MVYLKDKSSLRPWHPPWIQAIVDDVGSDGGIFKDDADEGVRLVTSKASSIEIRQIVTAEDFNKKSTETTRARVDKAMGVFHTLGFDLLFRHPCRFLNALRVRSWPNFVLFDKAIRLLWVPYRSYIAGENRLDVALATGRLKGLLGNLLVRQKVAVTFVLRFVLFHEALIILCGFSNANCKVASIDTGVSSQVWRRSKLELEAFTVAISKHLGGNVHRSKNLISPNLIKVIHGA